MKEAVEATCPYCGEPVDVYIDEDGGRHQTYVEDCPVCCQPWQVEVRRNSAGDWDARLQTSEE
jgi:hypothetical protein